MSARIEEVEEKPLLAEVDQPDSPHAQPKGEEVKHLVASLAALIAENINEQERVTTGIVKENTVWDVYNNEARKVDIELVKDWRESLNFLLVFVSTIIFDFLSSLRTFTGGHFCCGLDSIHHREQEDARARPGGAPGEHHRMEYQ